MQDHALIGECLGFWPIERDLLWWIAYCWKPRGGYDLWLGSKGFFTIVLHNLEDRERVFENGPYFYNLEGSILPSGGKNLAQKRRNSNMLWSRFSCTPCQWNFGSLKPLNPLETT